MLPKQLKELLPVSLMNVSREMTRRWSAMWFTIPER